MSEEMKKEENIEKVDETKKEQKDISHKPEKKSGVKVAIVNGLFKILGILVIAAIVYFGVSTFQGKLTTTIAISSVLKDTKNISVLQTLQVPYNSVLRVEAEKKKETDETKYKYAVAYNGTVTFGIDFDKIEVKEDSDKKQIIVRLPSIKITDTYVDPNSIVAIYLEDKKANTEFSFIDRRKECDDDLRNKANTDERVLNMAQKTAQSTINNLLKPFADKLYKDYEIIVVSGEEGND